jgi:hypothetical protein
MSKVINGGLDRSESAYRCRELTDVVGASIVSEGRGQQHRRGQDLQLRTRFGGSLAADALPAGDKCARDKTGRVVEEITGPFGGAGNPYRVELWANGSLIRAVGDSAAGQQEFRVYP